MEWTTPRSATSRARTASFWTYVGQGSVVRCGELAAAVRRGVRTDFLEDGNGRAGGLQPFGIETNREYRSFLREQQMSRGDVAPVASPLVEHSSFPGLEVQSLDRGVIEAASAAVRREEDSLAVGKDLGPAVRDLALCERRQFLRLPARGGNPIEAAARIWCEDNRVIGAPASAAVQVHVAQNQRGATGDGNLLELCPCGSSA